METFKTIHEYPNYLVSDLGNILSIRGGRLLKPYKCSNGYLQVKLTNNGCTKGELVHRLVAKAFIPNPNNLAQINHNVLVREWNSTMEIERVLGYKNTNIGLCCRGKSARAYGYVWRYKSI